MRPPGQMNEPFSISRCGQSSGEVKPNCEKLLFVRRSRRGSCATGVLRTAVGWRPNTSLSTPNAYGHPCVFPVDRPIDLAGSAGARCIIFLLEPRPFSWQGKYSEALMDIAFRAYGFDYRVFCR